MNRYPDISPLIINRNFFLLVVTVTVNNFRLSFFLVQLTIQLCNMFGQLGTIFDQLTWPLSCLGLYTVGLSPVFGLILGLMLRAREHKHRVNPMERVVQYDTKLQPADSSSFDEVKRQLPELLTPLLFASFSTSLLSLLSLLQVLLHLFSGEFILHVTWCCFLASFSCLLCCGSGLIQITYPRPHYGIMFGLLLVPSALLQPFHLALLQLHPDILNILLCVLTVFCFLQPLITICSHHHFQARQ